MVLCRFLRLLQLLVLVYVFTAVLYTTNLLLVTPLHTCLSTVFTQFSTESTLAWSLFPIRIFRDVPITPSYLSKTSDSDIWPEGSFEEVIYWKSDNAKGLRDGRPIPMKEILFLSKAFTQSMQPSTIVPFFYRATGTFEQEDITITTLITSNRFKVFSQLVRRYNGPISVTIHVKNITSHVHDLLDHLHELYTSTPLMSTNVDVHLVVDSFDRQFNTWRNIARLFARTDFVMMLDIDFVVCTDFRTAIRNSKTVMDKLRKGNAAFVVPAFEYMTHSDGLDQTTFPTDKETLLALVEDKRLDMFHATWPVGHNSTEYDRYYTAQPGEIYKVTRYQSAYEPYIIYKKEGPPWCDERFVGYGGNKAACHFEMRLSGMSYYVLADHFLVHQNHLYEEVARKNERKYNRKVYNDFKEETCLRYIKSFHDHAMLNTTQGYNLLEECQKIKGVSRIAAQLIQDGWV